MSKNPLSGFAPKQTIESSALAAYPHSATFELASRQRMTVKRDNVGQSRSNKSRSEWKQTDVCTW